MLMLIIKSILLGIGLAMDAFSISLANGLNEPNMNFSKQVKIATTFGFFQCMMPLIGYLFVSCLTKIFSIIKMFLPYISFALLFYIGIKLIIDGIKSKNENTDFDIIHLTWKLLILQAIITSIDALSVGFTMNDYSLINAIFSTIIIGITTFVICVLGVKIGKFFGMRWKKPSLIFGGCILILIGVQILLFR